MTNRSKDIDPAAMLAISDISIMNEYTISSSLTETQPISMEHNRRLVNEMIDCIFDERKGTCEISSSQCSSLKLQSSDYSYDKRLKYWKDVLKEREKLSYKIQQETEKNPENILYNRLTTMEARDKETVKRLMDYAERLNPTVLNTRKPLVLAEKCNAKQRSFVTELQETLPQTERQEKAVIEISGLPKVTQKEILGKSKSVSCKKTTNWLKSKYLEKSIEEKRDDIEHIIEYYPDIENLQIVGESLLKGDINEHNSEIQIMSSKEICKVSSDTLIEVSDLGLVQECHRNVEEIVDYGFKINDQIILMSHKRCSNNMKTFAQFSCFPFQEEVKKIFTIQNIGRKALTFEWAHRSYYNKNSGLLKCCDNEFVFDNLPFRLCSGEVQEIYVKFQPRKLNIVKTKWILKVKPSFFIRKLEGIVMRLSGICSPHPEYEQKLNDLQKEVIEKSNKKMINKLTAGLSSLAIDLPNHEFICPYQRSLNEMELFEEFNRGYKCERYHDLELLKDLYKRAKKPRDKIWDLKVNSLKRMILNVPLAETRALLFNELISILDTMKGCNLDLETKIANNTERNRTCFLYIRGIITTAIEEWLDLLMTLEETFYQRNLTVLNNEIAKQDLQEEDNNEDDIFIGQLPLDEFEKREYILEKRVRRLKSYQDVLYLQTYSLLCDFVENIVNIIESTEIM